MFLENELSVMLPLEGDWEFRLGAGPLRSLPVPSAWEAHLPDKRTDGPGIYRRRFEVPESWLAAAVITLEVDAISFEATIRINGEVVGTHQGIWSPFQLDITHHVRAGSNTLEIEVWKPGQRFPVRETLAGFLPDVATTFGGIWQGIRLRVFSWAALSDIRLFAYGGGWLDVQGRIVGLGERRKYEIVVELIDGANQPVTQVRADIADDHSFAAHLEIGSVQNWAPRDNPALYSVRVAIQAREAEIARVTRRVGFRDLDIQAGKMLLDESPLHVRGVLDWGWDPDRICPTPSRDEVLDNFAKARALGFNLFKLCLFVPDETLFNMADETGMLLWLEMPMWQPHVTPEFRQFALGEYRDVFQRLHHHPSIAVLSLGCELDAQVDAELLTALDALARDWFPNALHCDNSGSAEVYGGVTTSLSDFYDYHFYTEPHFFKLLVQHFRRPYWPHKPWLYGEFCDADTLRDFSLLVANAGWLTEPTLLDHPDFNATRDYQPRLRQANISDGGAALTAIARQQATAVRKFMVEQARAESATGGYVITGWRDTPITTSGVVDDRRALKFSSEAWQAFNADRVLILDRERRRHWINGDRPVHQDPYTWWQGETAEFHLILSNGGDAVEGASLVWQLVAADGSELTGGEKKISLEGGEVREVMVVNTRLPFATGLLELQLIATLKTEAGSHVLAHNRWQLWAVPPLPAETESGDPEADAKGNVVAALSDAALTRVHAGESLLVWLKSPDPRFTRALTFWRESIHVFESGAVWQRMPHPGFADMRFFSLATDFAIDLEKLAALLGLGAKLTPLWRRFDARQLFWTEYVLEVKYGVGRMILTTLRFAGGLGCQPDTLRTNPMGAWLLESLLKF